MVYDERWECLYIEKLEHAHVLGEGLNCQIILFWKNKKSD